MASPEGVLAAEEMGLALRIARPTAQQRSFMHVANLAPLLQRLHAEVRRRRRHTDVLMDWDFVFHSMVVPFVTRLSATVQDANLLFWNEVVAPFLHRDRMLWRHAHDTADKRVRGIPHKEYRSYAPPALDRGRPRDTNKATADAQDISGYLLTHPFQRGHARLGLTVP